jgi:hypothetical protein
MPPARKPWIKVDADADESDKLAGLPSHAARWGWFRMMCRAKTQRRMGVFAGPAHLRQLLGAEGRYVPDLVKAGLLHVWPTDCGRCADDYAGDATAGDVVVHDYRREQRDPTNAERQERHRNGVRNAESNGTVPLYSRALSPSLYPSPSETNPREPYQVPPRTGEDVWHIATVIESLVGTFPFSPGSRIFDRMSEDVAALGRERVEAAYRSLRSEYATEPMDAAGIVFGAHKRLYPIPDAPRTAKPVGKGGVSVEEAERAFRS